MATGQLQGGGLFAWPDLPELGPNTWAQMTGMAPEHPLVGGSAGRPGYGSAATRRVAIADQSQQLSDVASGAPARAHFSELANLRGNPIGWVLIIAVLYLGVMHIHVRAGASGGIGLGKGKR